MSHANEEIRQLKIQLIELKQALRDAKSEENSCKLVLQQSRMKLSQVNEKYTRMTEERNTFEVELAALKSLAKKRLKKNQELSEKLKTLERDKALHEQIREGVKNKTRGISQTESDYESAGQEEDSDDNSEASSIISPSMVKLAKQLGSQRTQVNTQRDVPQSTKRRYATPVFDGNANPTPLDWTNQFDKLIKYYE